MGTSQGLHARVTRLATPHLNLTVVTDDGHTAGTVMDLQDHESLVNIAQQGGFWSYIAGTAYRIVTDFELAGCGLVINNHTTTLPLKKGLSSSAAICVLVRTPIIIIIIINTDHLLPTLVIRWRVRSIACSTCACPLGGKCNTPMRANDSPRVVVAKWIRPSPLDAGPCS